MSKTKFKDCDWDEGTAFNTLNERSFFPYSGSDGDLFRKHGLGGWRVSVYGRYLVKIQKKKGKWKGRNVWNTVERWEADDGDLSEDEIQEFAETLDSIINGDYQ